jgi:hypothetical protein
MRRRHGIPDNDHRPFNVAYAAAKRAEKEHEAEKSGKSKHSGEVAPSAIRREQGLLQPETARPRPATGKS